MPFVQFTDSTETVICSVFCCSQNATEFPNQSEVSETDPRYETYVASLPAQMQKGL